MARYAILESNVVIDFAEAEAGFAAERGWRLASGDVHVGHDWNGSAFLPPVIPLPVRKSQISAAINAHRDSVLRAGFTPSSGPLSGKTLQTRDNDDKVNWLTSQAAYSAAVAAGNGAVSGATFRTAANETVTCTYLEGLQTLLAMAAWGKTVMGNSWALKDAVAAATDESELDAIDIGAGWP